MDFTFLIVAASFCVTLVYVKSIGLPTAVVTQWQFKCFCLEASKAKALISTTFFHSGC